MAHLYIVIPVLNEAENIPTLAQNCKDMAEALPESLTPHYIFIDDGSTDNTVEVIKEEYKDCALDIISHTQNQGPGKAFANAFSHLYNALKDDDWVLTMEGDNTSNHEIVAQMFHRSQEDYDLILASPFMYGGSIINTMWWKKLLSFLSNHFLRELLGLQGIHTMSSFFRLHRGSLIHRMQQIYGPDLIESKGFEGVVELLMKFVFHKTSISEVPLILDTAKRKGKSKMKIFKTATSLILLLRHKRRWKKQATTNKITPSLSTGV